MRLFLVVKQTKIATSFLFICKLDKRNKYFLYIIWGNMIKENNDIIMFWYLRGEWNSLTLIEKRQMISEGWL